MTTNSFNDNGYVLVKNALNLDIVNVITQYALFDEMQNFSPDGVQVPNAHSRYADPAMESILLHLHSTMEKNTGLELDPTYSFYRVYREGDELVKHKDRESCEVSCTLSFNFSYDMESYTWPIYMDGTECSMKPGDMVIYRGCDLDHWRESFFPPNKNDWHVQGFFHYVDKNGPYRDFKYDKRNSIGEINKTNSPQKNYLTFY